MKMLREREKDNITYLASGTLDAAGGVVHAFSTRKGGVSAPPFASLNFDSRDVDSPENISRNRALFASAVGFSAEQMARLVLLNQVHGAEVIEIDKDFNNKVKDADAMITDVPGVPLGIMTADCVPVLLYDPVKKAVGAAHAGWKGSYLKISGLTVKAMQERFGSSAGDILAAIGPFIGPCCYNVRQDVRILFKEAFGPDSESFFRGKDGLNLDMGRVNVHTLLEAGLKKENISISGLCTACRNGLFFSYRKEEGRTGRQISVIMLKEGRK